MVHFNVLICVWAKLQFNDQLDCEIVSPDEMDGNGRHEGEKL